MFYEIKKSARLTLGCILAPLAAIVMMVLSQSLSIALLGCFYPNASPNGPVPIEAELFAFAADWIPLLLWARLVEKTPWAAMGVKREKAGKKFLTGWLIGGGMLVLSVLLMAATGGLRFSGASFSLKKAARFLLLCAAWTVQGGTEEVFCRGWLFSSVAARRGVPAGIAVSAAFFAVMHLGNDGIAVLPLVDLVLFGVLAALYMLWDNHLFGIAGLHAAWNCLQGSLFNFPVSGHKAGDAFISVVPSGPDWLSGGAFGVEGTAVSIAVELAVIAFLIVKLKKNGVFKTGLKTREK